jgi:hypothetical protein
MPLPSSRSPFRSEMHSILTGYAQRRATIRQFVQKLQKLDREYRATLDSLDGTRPVSLEYQELDAVNSKGQELSTLGNAIWTEQNALSSLTEHLQRVLPYATEDLLRRGNKIIISEAASGDASFLLCYAPDGIDTQEYVVESLGYGEDIEVITLDPWRMLTIEQLLEESDVKMAMPYR